ncbi:AMP-binding protein [Actinoplanes sp. LDG1-06]|uniref:AMP-binding protein n=1 Tax=Paractinoplanes ovalisporus TaxID=2810368 RepID=A0ABS2AJV2_9ACTN|nr:AMP-binding protein [Actinoplanes ovalisporus]MBM2620130.1 AMP-binding protein [Actinoplanes ovalisporus]
MTNHDELSQVGAGIWFLSRLCPPDVALTVTRTFRVDGPLDVPAVRAAWEAAQLRHAALRTTVDDRDGVPVARCAEAPHPDAYRVARGDRPGAAEREPLSLATGPVARLTVMTVAPARHLLVLAAHRAVADEDSLTVLAGEILTGRTAVAAAAVGGRAGASGLQRARWWAEQLRGVRPARQAPAVRPGPMRTVAFDWGSGLAAGLRGLARAEGATVATVLLAGLQVLLDRHGRYGVVAGVPLSLRGPADADTVGSFTTLRPVLPVVRDDMPFHQAVRLLTTQAHEALRHALPFPAAVRAAAPARDRSGQPLCDVLLTVAADPVAPEVPGLRVTTVRGSAAPPFPGLALHVDLRDGTVAGELAAPVGHLAHAEAEGLPAQLATLLEAAVADPGRTVGDLPLASAPPSEPAPRPAAGTTVVALIRDRVRSEPGAVAVDDGARTTFAELWERSGRLAAWLCANGLRPGAAAAVRMSPGAAQVATTLAVLRAGGHVTWLAPGGVTARARQVLAGLRPELLLLDTDPAADELAGRHDGVTLTVPDPPDGLPFDRDEPAADGLAYAAFTSGSTGRPKGIAQTHAALAQFALWLGGAMRLGPDSRLGQWAAVEHDPSICETFAILVAGGTLCPVPAKVRPHPERFARWLAERRITALQTVPSFARELLRAFRADGGPAGLAVLVLMGEATPAAVAAGLASALPGARLLNVYGPTETVAATWHEIGPGDPPGVVPIGRAIDGRHVLVLDERDRPCPPGVRGELVVRSPYAIRSYLGADAGPRTVFRPVAGLRDGTPTYRTGDLARSGFTGSIEFEGRGDHQVKLAGIRIELSAVEAALAELPSVADCVVLPVAGPGGLVEGLAGYVVAGPEPDPAAWRRHLLRRFGPAMLRLELHTADGIPRTAVGKVDRSRLPRTATSADRPPSDADRRMAGIWAATGIAADSPDTNFFTAGGDSLALLRLAVAIRRTLGVTVALPDLLDAPTVAGMAATAAHAGADIPPDPKGNTSP